MAKKKVRTPQMIKFCIVRKREEPVQQQQRKGGSPLSVCRSPSSLENWSMITIEGEGEDSMRSMDGTDLGEGERGWGGDRKNEILEVWKIRKSRFPYPKKWPKMDSIHDLFYSDLSDLFKSPLGDWMGWTFYLLPRSDPSITSDSPPPSWSAVDLCQQNRIW